MSDGSPLTSDGEIDIQPLITKLAHSVEEIRVRALQNIVFKLDHDLLCVGDVVHKKELFVRLLEWFNFEPCSQQKNVLQLLEKLSKHSSGLDTLVSLGAIDFLSQLRCDIDPSLYQYIDNVLTSLLSLPEVVEFEEEPLHYGRGMEAVSSQPSEEPIRADPSQEVEETKPIQEKPASPVDDNQINPAGHRYEAAVEDHRTQADWRFPWIQLADSDRHVLATTNTRLQSNNSILAKKSCEFLSDVLFKDFPAEIFLQRPSIVQTLYNLLEIQSSEHQNLRMSAVTCLSTLCIHLKHRYLLMTDPQWYSLHPDCWRQWLSMTSVPSSAVVSPTSEMSDLRTNVHEGDRSSESLNRAGSVESAYDDEESDGLVREALELNQMSMDEFCLKVLRGCFSLLCDVADPLVLLGAVKEALNLLEVCYPQKQWWHRHKMKPLRQEVCCFVGKTINHHMLKCGIQASESIVKHNIPRHAITVVNIALWLMEFYGPMISSDLNDGSSDEDLVKAFRALITNEILSTALPWIRTSLESCPVLKNDADFMEVYDRVIRVKDSMVASVDFLKQIRTKGEMNQDSLILKLDSCLLGLPYHRNQRLIFHAIKLISNVHQRPSNHRETKVLSKNILLSILSCVDVVARRETYKCCCEVLKQALKHSHVTNPLSKHCSRALFMIDCDVIFILSAYGLADTDPEISQTASTIIGTLLDGRLNMGAKMWRKLLDDLVTSLSFLQMYLDKRTKLGSCLLGLLAPPGESPCSLTADGDIVPFSEFERLRGWLRCMLLKDKALRAKSYGHLIHRLVQQDLKEKREMVYPSGGLENSCDLFIVERFASSARSHRSNKHANFDEERISKLFDILTMETNELSLRKSSAEQLAVLLQDPSWHNVLLEENADELVVKILHESLYKDGKAHISPIVNPKLELVSPCLKILRMLAEYSVRCRHKLAKNSSVYDMLSRHALLAPAGGTVRYEVSCLMTLLLFDEVARIPLEDERREKGEDIMFALPALVMKRYTLPFNPPIYEMYNPYQREKQTECDPLRTEPMLSMLRVAWNLAWRESPDDIPEVTTENSDGVTEELVWTTLDSQLLKSCSPKVAVTEVINSIINATSHYAVRLSVHRLSMQFLADRRTKSREINEKRPSTNLAREVFLSCDWRTAFERYFVVFPKSADDDQLLGDVLKMFCHLITDSYSVLPEGFLGWLAHVIMTPDSVIASLLRVREEPGDGTQSESKRLLLKDLLEFLAIFLRRLRNVSKPWLWSGEMIYAGDFTLSLTMNLNLTDSPQYYDLPVLESTLQCLVEITAIPGFSNASKLVEPQELCTNILASLLQVLTAFNAGRLGALTSFMGRGVTMSVSLCLTHLVHETSSVLKIKDWPSVFPPIADSDNNADFPWLSTMWTDHLAEVRWCGLSIATHILQQTGSPLSVKQNFAGGLWNLAVTILMDGRECCLVRDQAAKLFSTLLVCMRKDRGTTNVETGLMVQSDEEIINGIPALHLLLSHHKFYSSFQQMLHNLVIQNTPRLPGTVTFAESLSTSSTRSKYGIPYQSLDTDSQRSSGRASTETTTLISSSSTGDSGKRLLRNSPETLSTSTSTGESTRASSTIPLLTGSRVVSTSTGNGNQFSTSPETVESLEILAWATPRFVASLSDVVTNLVQVSPETVLDKVKNEDVLSVFVRHLDNKYALSLISQLGAVTSLEDADVNMTSQQRHLEMNLVDILEMYKKICVLLVTCASKDPHILHALQQNTTVLERIVLLLRVNCSTLACSVQKSCHRMWDSVVIVFISLIKTVKGNHLLETTLERMMLKYWKIFGVALRHVMLTDELKIRGSFLHLLSHLLLREGKRMVSGNDADLKLTRLLDGDNTPDGGAGRADDVTVVPSQTSEERNEFGDDGAELCRILLLAYEDDDDKQTKEGIEERKFVVLALRHLLCISYKAKETAIEDGFLTKSLEKIKQKHYQLNMETLEVGKTSGPRKKEMEHLNEMVRVLETLKNLVFRSNYAKLKAIDAGVISVLQELWSWCTVVKTLCLPVLDLLCTLTARCSQASVAMSNTSSGVGSSVRLGPSNNTFVHCVIKMASKYGSKLLNNSSGHGNQASCQILFSLLKNMAMTSECRGIMWKSNFIVEFSRLKSLSRQKWKSGQKTIISLWLELLANISFHRDGQQMIVKIENFTPLLLEFCSSNNKKINEVAMLLLRNLCFHVPSKTLLLSNNDILEIILKNVDKSSVYMRAISTSALWALLTNNQKAKSILVKPALVIKRLSDSKLSLKQTATEGSGVNLREEKHREQYEQAVENILKILGS